MNLIKLLGAVVCFVGGIAIVMYGMALLVDFNDLTTNKFSKQWSATLLAIISISGGAALRLNGLFYLVERLQSAMVKDREEP